MKRKHTSFTKLFYIIGIFIFLNISSLFSKNSPINFSFVNQPLKLAIDSLVFTYDLNIVYRDQIVNDIMINAICNNCNSDEAIQSLLDNTYLDWKKNNYQYIIINNKKIETISGYIIDVNSGEYIPHANVYVKEGFLGTMSDEFGFFKISGDIDATDTLVISYIGYHPLKVVNSVKNEVNYFEIVPKILDVETINIFGKKIDFLQRSSDHGVLSFSPRHITNLPNIGETDVFRSLQLLPGIQMGNSGFAGLFIRGGTPDQNRIILDGMTVYQVDHFFGFFSSINSNIVKDVQIYKSGFPAKFGGGISSIINITGKSGSTKKQKLDLFTNMLSAGFTYQKPISKRGSLIFSARRSFTDQYQTKLYDKIHNFLVSGTGLNIGSELPSDSISYESQYFPNFYFYDINAKFTYLPTKKDIFSISFYEGKDYLGEQKKFNFPLDSVGVDQVKTDEKTRWGNSGVSTRWLHRWSETVTLQLGLSRTTYQSNHSLDTFWSVDTILIPVYLSKDKNTIIDQTLRFNISYNASKTHLIEAGLINTNYHTDYSVDLGDSIIFINENIKGSLVEGYIQDRWYPLSKFEILFGLRLEKFSKGSQVLMDPRFTASYHLTNNFSLKISLTRSHQYLNRFNNDLITNGSKFVWLIPNKHMRPMSSIQKNLGFQYDNLEIFFGFDFYSKTVNNISDFSQLVFPVDVYSSSSNMLTFQGEGISNGLELFVHKKNGKLKGWASYNYGIIQCNFPQLNGGETFLADHDRTHELKSAIISSFGKWTLTITGLITSGRVFTPRKNLMIRENENANFTLQAEPGTRNTKRLPTIQRVDLSLNRSILFWDKNIDIGLSIFNVFDRKNISHRSYNLLVEPFITTDVKMLGFTPTVSIQMGF
mgnify:FL=1